MEIASLLPSTDNLYKFLFMGGIFMIAFSYVFPLQRQQQFELDLIEHNKRVDILNSDITRLYKEVQLFDSAFQLSTTVPNRGKKDSANGNGRERLSELRAKQVDANRKSIELQYDKKKILLIQHQIHAFSVFRSWFISIGCIFTIAGLIFWVMATVKNHSLQSLEKERLALEVEKLKVPPTPAAAAPERTLDIHVDKTDIIVQVQK